MTSGTTTPAGPTGALPRPRPALSAQTWRELAYLTTSWPLDLLAFCYVMVWIFAASVLSLTVVGLPFLAAGLTGVRLLGRAERARARALLGLPIEEPSPLAATYRGAGFFGWLWNTLKDPVGWRTALFFPVRLVWGLFTFVACLPCFFLLWPLLPWLARGASHVDRALVRALLAPSDGLERRIAELESDRATVLDAPPPICAVSSAICTTGRRPASSRSPWTWASPGRSCSAPRTTRPAWWRRRTAR
jgi:hypothetical protein